MSHSTTTLHCTGQVIKALLAYNTGFILLLLLLTAIGLMPGGSEYNTIT
jgi:hypothetical protein